VALDRQSIEKKDFPIGRRGYDPDAVDSHLKALADEIDELKRSARRRSESLASSLRAASSRPPWSFQRRVWDSMYGNNSDSDLNSIKP